MIAVSTLVRTLFKKEIKNSAKNIKINKIDATWAKRDRAWLSSNLGLMKSEPDQPDALTTKPWAHLIELLSRHR